MVPATMACCARTCPCQAPVADKFSAPFKSPSPWTSPETTNCPVPRMSPTNTELAPINVGLAAPLSRNRRFCWVMATSYRIKMHRGVTSLAARIEVECRHPDKPLQSVKMVIKQAFLVLSLTAALALSGCSRQQSDWEKTRATNTTDAYELFLKKYPSGEFSAQAKARVKELYEERDWQKARDTDTAEAYQAFLKQYPEGKFTEEARIRVENFNLAASPAPTGSTDPVAAGGDASPD